MNSEHVEVLRELRDRAAMNIRAAQGAAESARPRARVAALDAAIASLSAPQSPAEAQPVVCDWPSCDCTNGRAECGRKISQPPSAPVGVEAMPGLRSELSEIVHRDDAEMVTIEPNEAAAILRALAQQPEADGGFTAADMMDARQEGRKEAQQSAAVDGAMVERALAEWRRLEGHQPDAVRMHAALTAALAAQQGGSDNGR